MLSTNTFWYSQGSIVSEGHSNNGYYCIWSKVFPFRIAPTTTLVFTEYIMVGAVFTYTISACIQVQGIFPRSNLQLIM